MDMCGPPFNSSQLFKLFKMDEETKVRRFHITWSRLDKQLECELISHQNLWYFYHTVPYVKLSELHVYLDTLTRVKNL